MAKKRKNSNYVTEKTEKAKIEKLKQEKIEKTKKILIPTAITVAAIVLVAALIVTLVVIFGDPDKKLSDVNDGFKVTHHASITVEGYGNIHLELYGEEAPKTVENFVKLANSGYYNGTEFHRIIEGFMAQGGTGKGTDSIKGEFSSNGVNNDILHVRGAISMARTDDKNSASDQFFIVHEDSEHLDGNYAAFGMVTDGIAVIDEICEDAEPTDNNGSIAKANRPIITSISIHEAH
ncbi:MAG: peptidylprolyl isomerase [Clostridia bacterium]|nr:peptidylprolyl isomerase [Clostridia bacterium]